MINKYEKLIDSEFSFIKKHDVPLPIIIRNERYEIYGFLEAITEKLTRENDVIRDLKIWREENQQYFPSQFKVTIKGTKIWAATQLIEKKDRILFFINDLEENRVGHIGLYRFDYRKKTCEIDNVIRGTRYSPGIMTCALNALINWTYQELKVKTILLTVFADNPKAISLYRRCGFNDFKYVPLKKEVVGDAINWVEIKKTSKEKPERQYLVMRHRPKS